ncbi:MAG: hypothetical protein ACE5I5_13235 [Candidatus Heimdallarchaeota archaeon]
MSASVNRKPMRALFQDQDRATSTVGRGSEILIGVVQHHAPDAVHPPEPCVINMCGKAFVPLV